LSDQVLIYTFNNKSAVWWSNFKYDLKPAGVKVYQLPWREITQLAALAEKTMSLSLTISGPTVFIASETSTVDLCWSALSEV
jgi:uncharacterized protein YaeQ